jgi:lysophospholipase L1-like esterase
MEEEPLPLERRIVVISDSIGAGFGAGSNFPAILQGITGIEVINQSTPGISAEAGVSKAPGLIDRLRPMYLVVLLGTNNAAGAAGGVSGAISALRYAAGVASENGVIPVIGTLPPISRDPTENANASAISGGIAGIGGARIARIDQVVGLSDIGDGLHPNDNGQAKIAQAFAGQIY